jgi:2-dehydro-3-deoxyphosphogluconate aldolase / (4S)-4-hydroxy-2-oxoglutarate aldolase
MTALERLGASKVAAVIRAPHPDLVLPLSKALLAGGIDILEVTTSTPDAVEAIRQVHEELGDTILLGLGTTLDASLIGPASDAGAKFIVSPVFDITVVEEAKSRGLVAIPGCATPTEAWTASRAGADIIKIFPAGPLGPSFIKDLLAPLPFLKIMPTGGVDSSNVGEWLKAGAFAVGAGSNLVDKKAMAEGRWDIITEKAREYRRAADSG